MNYDKNNIFAKIIRGEIPLKPKDKIYENEFVLSFYDINPKKKIHALVIPKGEYTDLDDFSKNIIFIVSHFIFVFSLIHPSHPQF